VSDLSDFSDFSDLSDLSDLSDFSDLSDLSDLSDFVAPDVTSDAEEPTVFSDPLSEPALAARESLR
jgi:hypothetical protein